MALTSGTRLGSYEISDLLGKGGMGEVYRARDTKLGREVAIKVLPAEFSQDEERLARLEREARMLASLNHPNIAAIHGLEESDGARFLVLELVEGDTLADQIKRGAIPVEGALKLALQIAEALEAAHEKGVIHRDLKPANIKVTPDGKVKILDFGLAKAFAGDQPDVSLSNSPTLSMQATQQGVILGTAAYMSPEQARGDVADHRTDVWAFGCVLFEMLSGEQTWAGRTVTDIIGSIVAREPDWAKLPSALHPRVRILLERCLEKEAKDRCPAVAEARNEIQKTIADPGGLAPRPVEPAARRATPLPWVAAIILVGTLAAVAAWNLRTPDAGPVVRFSHILPEGQQFSGLTRPVVALSPDASRLVYVAGQQLHIRQLDTFESNPIPGTDEFPTNPFFSPDGQWIGYWSGADQQLKKIAVGGGAPIVIAAVGNPIGSPIWGDDDMIVFGRPEGVMTVSANGGTPQALIAASGADVTASPAILPGGEAVLFALAAGPADQQVAVQRLDSDEPRVLFPGNLPRYVPTGHIVYELDSVLFAVPFDIDSMEVGGPVSLVEGVRGPPAHYAISDSGSLAYVAGELQTESYTLALLDRSGGVERLDVPTDFYVNPALSPDGRQLAVQTANEEGNTIHVYSLTDGTVLRRLTQQGEGDNLFPLWTPDSERVTFASDRSGTWGIYSQAADGSPAELLWEATDDRLIYPESWSPDGETLVFTQGASALQGSLWTLRPGEAEPEPLLAEEGVFHATLSPDGNWLAYNSVETGGVQVFVQPFPPTGAKYQVTDSTPGLSAEPLWSADGQVLTFLRGIPIGGQVVGVFQLMAVDVQRQSGFVWGSEELLQVREFFGANPYRDYAITSDGERVLAAIPEGAEGAGAPARPQIDIVQNWIEELKERVPVP